MSVSVLAVIPARYASSRFPGKPLAMIAGKPMIQHVWERVRRCGTVEAIVVATDDERIRNVCQGLGIDVQMTSADHATGTDRLSEVAELRPAEIYVNVQGDEPLVAPATIDDVVNRLRQTVGQGIEVSTAYRGGATPEEEASTSIVHLVPTTNGRVLTVSRLPVPCAFRNSYQRFVHLGLYAFTEKALKRFSERRPGPVELAESIELFRFLEFGDGVACVQVSEQSIGVDHPEDIARVEALMRATAGAG